MFRNWCKQYTASDGNITHALMDGGCLSIPFDKLREFYATCVKSVLADEQIFVVERLTPVYNFFLDVDYNDDEELSLETVQTICQIVCDKVQHIMGPSPAIISVAEPKKKDDKIKTGIHINWPGLTVNQDGAIQLMHHVISCLNNVYIYRDWSRVVDASVYGELGKQGSGFRMPWSHKKIRGVVEGVYLPILEYQSDTGKLERVSQRPSIHMLMKTTTRCETGEPRTVPECVVLCQPVKRRHEGDFTPSELKNEVNNPDLEFRLERFINKFMPGQEKTRVQKIFKMKDRYLVKTTSRYCENIQREHGSNHIKLVIEPNGEIHQRCFCRCETKLKVQCKDFRSRGHMLTGSIRDLLYPPGEKRLKKFGALQ